MGAVTKVGTFRVMREALLKERFAFYYWLRHWVGFPWNAPSLRHLEVALDALEGWPEEPSFAWTSNV